MMMMRNLLGVALLASIALSSACVRKHGTFDAQGFEHHDYQLRVLASPVAPPGKLLPPEWRLDNYYGEDNKPKRTSDYLITYELDTNGDGRVDLKNEELLYDLRFEHRYHAGLLWLRTIPIGDELRQTELRVIMRGYVDALASSGYTAVTIRPGELLVEQQRMTAKTLATRPSKLGGAPAFEAVVDVADVDALALDPNARRKRAKLVVARTPFEYAQTRGKDGFAVLLVAGYVNFPEDFDAGLPDFDDLLNRVQLAGVAGYAPAAAPPPSAAPPPVALPPAPVQPPEPPASEAEEPDPEAATPAEPAPAPK